MGPKAARTVVRECRKTGSDNDSLFRKPAAQPQPSRADLSNVSKSLGRESVERWTATSNNHRWPGPYTFSLRSAQLSAKQ